MGYIKDRDTVIASLVETINQQNSAIDTEKGRVIRDVSIDAPALEFSKLYYIYDYLAKCQSLDGFEEIFGDVDYQEQIAESFGETTALFLQRASEDLEKLAANWNVMRKSAAKATGIARFKGTQSVDVSIDKDFKIATNSIPAISFETTESFTGLLIDYESSTGLYYVDIPIKAVEGGINGNKIQGSINVLNTALANISIVSNLFATTGGQDAETNIDLIQRARLLWLGQSAGTVAGYKKLMLEEDEVGDVLVVGPAHQLMQRSPEGAVDIYVLAAKIYTKNSCVINYLDSDIVLPLQPVLSIDSIIGNSTYLENIHFVLEKDIASFARSYKAQDKIKWLSPPTLNESLTIAYFYNSFIHKVQDKLDIDENNVIVANILIKEALQININLEFDFSVYSSYVKDDIKTEISTVLTSFFSAKLLGEDIDVSDVLYEITKTPGVDSVDTQTFRIGKEANLQFLNEISGGFLIIQDVEYARLNSISFLS